MFEDIYPEPEPEVKKALGKCIIREGMVWSNENCPSYEKNCGNSFVCKHGITNVLGNLKCSKT